MFKNHTKKEIEQLKLKNSKLESKCSGKNLEYPVNMNSCDPQWLYVTSDDPIWKRNAMDKKRYFSFKSEIGKIRKASRDNCSTPGTSYTKSQSISQGFSKSHQRWNCQRAYWNKNM